MNTRDLILETAFKSFLEKGYDNISLNEIIKRTGMTKGAFYYFFSNKEQLLKETVEKYIFSYIAAYGGEVIKSGRTAAETMYMMADVMAGMFDVVCERTGVEADPRDFYSLFMTVLGKNNDLYKRNNKYQASLRVRIEELITRGIESGEFRSDINAAEVVYMTSSMLHGIMFDWVHDEDTELVHALRKGIGAVLRLIKA